MTQSYEYVLSDAPFVVRRTVRWGDCDPAGVVYTGRFPDYLLGALALFKDHIAGGSGESLGQPYGVGLPCRGMTFDFAGTLWPNDVVDLECYVGEIRTRSFDFHCEGRRPGGETVFTARFSPICVHTHVRESTDIPAPLRATLARHGRAVTTR